MKFAATSSKVRISGRVLREKNIAYLGYSGSFVEFTYTGTYVKAQIDSKSYVPGDSNFDTWVAVFVNGADEPYARFKLEEGVQEYELYHAEREEETTVRLMKMSEAAFGSFGILSFETDDPHGAKPSRELQHRIEFIGDSITCGYGNEGVANVDVFRTGQENPVKGYAILTAKALKAEYQLISWSGIGIISNWVEETVNEPNEEILMPTLYSYIDKRTSEAWDFTKWKYAGAFEPDLIVINIGTNDASYVRNIPERERAFVTQYYAFLKQVRICNPEADILCILGVMDQRLCEQIEEAVNRFAEEQKDQKVFFHMLRQQQAEDGLGTDDHPSALTHMKLSQELTDVINQGNFLRGEENIVN